MKRLFYDSYGMNALGMVVTLVLVFVAIVAISVVGVAAISSAGCGSLGQQTGYPTRYIGPIGPGCMIEIDGQWIPSSKWIYNNGN